MAVVFSKKNPQTKKDFEAFMAALEKVVDDPDYEWAHNTLSGIHEWCSEAGVVTDNQEAAVANILGAEKTGEKFERRDG